MLAMSKLAVPGVESRLATPAAAAAIAVAVANSETNLLSSFND